MRAEQDRAREGAARSQRQDATQSRRSTVELAEPGTRSRTEWERALDAMGTHLHEIRQGLERRGPLPEAYAVPVPDTPLPPELASRAGLLASEQDDLEIALRERMGILGAAIHRDPLATRAAISLYVDRVF